EKAGPRKSMVVAGTAWVLGFFIADLGITTGQLWLVYFGYGFIGGIGLGIGYISPVSTLMKWFPDRPGLATGLAIMGFGWRCTDCQPVISSANEVIWWRYRNRGPCHRFGAHLYYTGNQLDRKSTRLNSSHVSISYAVF